MGGVVLRGVGREQGVELRLKLELWQLIIECGFGTLEPWVPRPALRRHVK